MSDLRIPKERPAAVAFLEPIADELTLRMSKLVGKGGDLSEVIADAVRRQCWRDWDQAINTSLAPRPVGRGLSYVDVQAALRRLKHKNALTFLEKLSYKDAKAA